MPEAEWKEPHTGCGYELAEAVHTMNKTKKLFRLVIKRELRKQKDLFDIVAEKYHHYAVATNWPEEEKNAQAALTWHNQRGQAENFNKELKGGFGQDQMPCGESYANAVYFRIGVIAYNLFIGFKRLTCFSSWAHYTMATFRWKLIQIAGRVVRHAGKIILKLAVDDDKFKLFQDIRQQYYDVSLAP